MQFLAKKPRELKGADTSGKYDYQKDVSICLLLEYHFRNDEYLFVFDYHDDLVILNSEHNPIEYNFFQIKGHDKGSYTLNQILARKKLKVGLSSSILGKLYSHLEDFKLEIKSVNFISNRDFSIPYGADHDCKNYSEICLKDLHPSALKTIHQKLMKEFGVSSIDPDFPCLTFLKVSSLSVKDSSGHTKGKLAEFLQTMHPGVKCNPDLIYQNIFDEVKRKSRYDMPLTTLDELIRYKGISKSYFSQMLSIMGTTKDYDVVWNRVSNALTSERVKAGQVLQYRSAWKMLEVERMNSDNLVLKEAFIQVSQIIEENKTTYSEKSLIEIVNDIKPKLIRFENLLQEDLLTAIIFSKLYE